MYKKVLASGLLLIGWLLALPALAQDSVRKLAGPALTQDSSAVKKVEMADRFRADGKIYVVIAVVVVILLGLILYVARLDRKISRFEKEAK